MRELAKLPTRASVVRTALSRTVANLAVDFEAATAALPVVIATPPNSTATPAVHAHMRRTLLTVCLP
jgi:hypothetical protein